MTIRNRVIAGIFAIAGIRLLTGSSSVLDDIPPNHTGEVDVICEGDRFEMDSTKAPTLDVIKSTRTPLTATILTLEFKNGHLTGWKPTLALDKRGEEPQIVSQLISKFEDVCQADKRDCTPIPTESGDYELYYTKGNAAKGGGIGLLSKDLSYFGGYHEIADKVYGDAMTCKISR